MDINLINKQNVEYAIITLRELSQHCKGQGIGAIMILEEYIQTLEEKMCSMPTTKGESCLVDLQMMKDRCYNLKNKHYKDLGRISNNV